MAKNADLVAVIVDETLACQNLASPQSKQRRGGRYAPLGPYINGPTGSFPTTDLAMDRLAELADRYRQNDPALLNFSSRDTMRELASNAVGGVLQELAHEPDRAKHWPLIRDMLRELVAQSFRDIMHYVPVWLFTDSQCDAFAIGPVRFLPRNDWPDAIEARRGSEDFKY